MGRIRSIKPEFPQSETVGRLSRDARLLFIQLWTVVDDAGRARAAPRMLASMLFPYDDDAPTLITSWLAELEENECVRRYEVEGTKYLDVPNWLKHQRISHASESKFPSFEEADEITPENSGGLGKARASRDSLSPSYSSSDPRQDQVEVPRECRATSDWPTDFRDQFWTLYPNKVGKSAAISKLEAIRKRRDVPWSRFSDGLRRYCAKTDDRPWCNPLTWLNQGRWDDEAAPTLALPEVNVAPQSGEIRNGKVWLSAQTDQFEAWRRHRGGIGPTDRNGGWFFDSEWPPDRDPLLQAAE